MTCSRETCTVFNDNIYHESFYLIIHLSNVLSVCLIWARGALNFGISSIFTIFFKVFWYIAFWFIDSLEIFWIARFWPGYPSISCFEPTFLDFFQRFCGETKLINIFTYVREFSTLFFLLSFRILFLTITRILFPSISLICYSSKTLTILSTECKTLTILSTEYKTLTILTRLSCPLIIV